MGKFIKNYLNKNCDKLFIKYNFISLQIFALFTPIALICSYFFIPSKAKSTLILPYYVSLSPFFLWMAVFFFQPHKEERYLLPIFKE